MTPKELEQQQGPQSNDFNGGFAAAQLNHHSRNAVSFSKRLLAFWTFPAPRYCLLLIPVLCIGFVLMGTHFIVKIGPDPIPAPSKKALEFDPNEIRTALFSSIDPARMASTLREITEEPHVAGTDANRRVAEKLAQLWKDNGLEQVRLLEYDVLLSYPNWTTPNHASVLSARNEMLFQSLGLSPDLLPPDGGGDDYHAAIQWLAYSGDGTVEGEPVYCHFGQREDFERLEKDFGIADLKGKIALIRYGKLFRGDKVKHALERQAAGVILFSDPADVVPDGKVFPETDNLPGHGVQRGSLMIVDGDATTPLLASRKDFYRQKTAQQVIDEGNIWTVPVLPLGYSDAEEILKRMAGPAVPSEWQGGMNVTYRIGPGFVQDQGNRLRVEVHSKSEIRTIQNVVGVIRGREEPDSWVMLGNHYDAWVFGSLDPNSGTVILAEVARAFATAAQRGWRPRRSLVFCAWDAEEYALIGSTEFVEEYADVLKERAVAYLNVDLISGNSTLDAHTVPTLYKAVTEAAKMVRNPSAEERAKGRKTVYDTWRANFPPDISWLPDTPHMDLPGGGSDHTSFLNFLGIPVVDFRYRNPSRGTYPLYHSRYELPFLNEHLIDHDNLAVHKAVGEYWVELARLLADSSVLPISAEIFARRLLTDYLAGVQREVSDLHAKYPAEMESALGQMQNLLHQAQLFLEQAVQFERDAELAEPTWANRRLRKLDQCFMNPAMGMAEKERAKRHVLFSLSGDDSYSAAVMATVRQKIAEVARNENAELRMESGRQLALQLTVVQNSVLCATNMLKPFL